MTNEVALVPFAEMERMALAIAKSGLFGIRTPDQALALMLVSQSEGRHPALAARDYDLINGRPAKKAESMLRDFLSAGGKIQWHELTDTMAKATFSHPQGGTVCIAWDIPMAKKAGLEGKEMYKKYPRQMLRSRCVSEGVRTIYPAATSGMYVPEEVRDIPAADTGGVTIDGTAEVLDQFAAEADPETGEVLDQPRDLLAEARSASLRGVAHFRDYWVALNQDQRDSIRVHMEEFEKAAKAADDPFGLEPLPGDLLHASEKPAT